MKKNLLYFFMLITTLNLFSSCDKDDKIEFIGEELNGVYKGALDIELGGTPIGNNIPQKVYITKTGDNMLKMELKNFSFTGLDLGDIVVEEIIVVKNGAENSFTGTQKLTLTGVGACDVTVIGDIKADVLDMDIAVKAGILNVVVDFEGTRIAADQSSEALITAFTFADTDKIIASQPVIDGKNITFIVIEDATADQIKALVPTIAISEKATITPVTGIAADFNKSVVYTVISEDGIYTNKYTVSIGGKSEIFNFDVWHDEVSLMTFKDPSPKAIFGTSNLGAVFLGLYTEDTGYKMTPNVFNSTDLVAGDAAAKLVTLDTRILQTPDNNVLVPGITPGSLFLGKFDMLFAFTNRLLCSRFGIEYTNKPLRFKGNYKYTAGSEFIDASDPNKITVVTGKKDECSIAAVLFEVESDKDVLTGLDVNTSKKRVAVAVLADGTDKAEYTTFDIPFTYLEGKSYDPTKKYKITFVCSSSKEGDTFKGAPNSTLFVDEFEIIYE